MPRKPPSPVLIPVAEARRIWLAAQKLDTEAPFGAGPAATSAAVRQLGYVQIDTINVIERCHHHILATRIPEYRRADLHHAQAVGRDVFEYWTHALAYVPSEDFRYFVQAMRRQKLDRARWFGTVGSAELRKVMRRLKDGPLSIRDIDDDVLVDKVHPWASRKPSKSALQYLFYAGVLTIAARTGMVKTYDLADRHFGWEARPRPASESARIAYLLDRALRAQGIVSLDSICHLDAPSKPAVRALIETRLRKKTLVPVRIAGLEKAEHWAEPAALEPHDAPPPELVHILSPFDPLVIQRRRLKRFFGYNHLFEAYVPKEKRKLGYFALPVLAGDEIVAALDLKTDRAARKLLVQRWTWTGSGSARRHKAAIEAALHRFERFQLAD